MWVVGTEEVFEPEHGIRVEIVPTVSADGDGALIVHELFAGNAGVSVGARNWEVVGALLCAFFKKSVVSTLGQ